MPPDALADATVFAAPDPINPTKAEAEAIASPAMADEDATSLTKPLDPHWQSVDAAPVPALETNAAHWLVASTSWTDAAAALPITADADETALDADPDEEPLTSSVPDDELLTFAVATDDVPEYCNAPLATIVDAAVVAAA